MTLLDNGARVAGWVRADKLQPGDIIQRRYRWTVQRVRIIAERERSTPGVWPYVSARPAEVHVRAHHTDRGEHGRTDTLIFNPEDRVMCTRMVTP